MTKSWIATLTSLTVLGLALALGAGICRADGDPASDALISQSVFYPYSSPVPAAAQTRLNRLVAEVHRSGVQLKVALIARAQDLGSITALYDRPARYADFLDTEISFRRPIPLLVVMPNGYGVAGLPASAARAIAGAAAPAGGDGAALARAATRVISRAFAVRSASRRPSRGSGEAGYELLLLALILAALVVGGALVVLRVLFPPGRGRAQGSGGNA